MKILFSLILIFNGYFGYCQWKFGLEINSYVETPYLERVELVDAITFSKVSPGIILSKGPNIFSINHTRSRYNRALALKDIHKYPNVVITGFQTISLGLNYGRFLKLNKDSTLLTLPLLGVHSRQVIDLLTLTNGGAHYGGDFSDPYYQIGLRASMGLYFNPKRFRFLNIGTVMDFYLFKTNNIYMLHPSIQINSEILNYIKRKKKYRRI